MKSVGGSWNSLLDLKTLLRAYHLASKGKKEVKEVRSFHHNLHENLNRMIAELSAGRYVFGPYRNFMVRDPKPRQIQVAPFEQRVMHHAIIQVSGSTLEGPLIADSYACRKGKGQHAAVSRAQMFSKQNSWYLKMDIRKFYDSVDQRRLLNLLKARFREKQFIGLLQSLLSSYETRPRHGLPIGNLTSQYFGNFYLSDLDHRIKELHRIRGYVRYMDDMILFSKTRAELLKVRNDIYQWLSAERGLDVKHGGELNRVSQGIPFLGFVIYPHHMRLHPRCAQRYSRKLASLKRLQRQGRCSEEELQQRSQSLAAATRLAEARMFRLAVEKRQTQI